MKANLVFHFFVILFLFVVSGCSDDDTDADINSYSGILGSTYLGSGSGTHFALYAPNATAVYVAGSFNSYSTTANPMTYVSGGVWETTVVGAAPGDTYKYVSSDFTDTWVKDPYGKSFNGSENDNTIIINDSYSWGDSSWSRPAKEALVIYELHVEDFTRYDSDATRGNNFLGMIDKISYLTNLGVNAVELMPVQEWGGVGYSWGYNTTCYFAPENSLSTDNSDGSAYQNFKKLVDALHQAGIAVIMDVVYNHTFEDSPLWKIDSTVYYSTDSIDWGKKLDLTSSATKRYIKDNLLFLMNEFHIDGFRFDSTENIDGTAMLGLINELVTGGYDDRYYIFEEFDGDHNTAIQAVNSAAGKSVISSWGNGYKDALWAAAVSGGSSDQLGVITYHSKDSGWTYPGSVINYFSSHDEGTLTGRGYSVAAIRTSAVHLLTALGIPMIWMGEEVLRFHEGNNSTNATAEGCNEMDWDALRSSNTATLRFFSALIKLRIAHPALRLTASDPANSGLFSWNMSSWDGTHIGYTYKGVSGDNDFVVLVNYSHTVDRTFSVTLPQTGNWYLMCDGVTATNLSPGLAVSNFTASSVSITVGKTNALVFMSSNKN